MKNSQKTQNQQSNPIQDTTHSQTYIQTIHYLDSELPSQVVNKQIQTMKAIRLILRKPNQEVFKTVRNFEPSPIADFTDLKKMIDVSVKASLNLTGKTCAFIIGKTGAGKSTLVHFLAGKKLMVIDAPDAQQKIQSISEDDDNDLELDDNQSSEKDAESDFQKPYVLFPEEPIEGFRISHRQKSETKMLNTLDFDGLVVVDTAGFMDSHGVVNDIANAIGLEKAFCETKQLKLLIIIAENTIEEGRGRALRELLLEILEFAPSLSIQELLPCISVAISKCKMPVKNLANNLHQIAEEVNENESSQNAKLKTLIKEIALKLVSSKKSKLNFAKRGRKNVMVKPEEGENWRNSLLVGKSIENPKKYFSISLKDESKKYIINILLDLSRQIKSICSHNAYDLLRPYLSQSFFLCQSVNIPQIKLIYGDCLEHVNRSIQQLCKDYYSCLSFAMSESGQLSDEIVLSLKESLCFVREVDKLVCFGEFGVHGGSFEKFCQFMGSLMENIVSSLLLNLDQIEQKYSALAKIQKLYVNFGFQIERVGQIYSELTSKMEELLIQHIGNIVASVKQGNYFSITSSFRFLDQSKDIFQKIFEIGVTQYRKNLINFVKDSLQLRFNETMKPQLNSICYSTIQSLKVSYEKWINVLSSSSVIQIVGEELTRKLTNELKGSIALCLKTKMRQIQQILDVKKFHKLEQPLLTVKSLKQMDYQLSSKAAEDYFQIIAKLNSEITYDSKEVFENSKWKIKEGVISESEIFMLKDKILKLKGMSWLEKIIEKDNIMEIYSNVLEVLESACKDQNEELLNLVEEEMQESEQNMESSLDLNETTSNQSNFRINSRVRKGRFPRVNNFFVLLKNFKDVIPKIGQQFNKAKTTVNEYLIGKVTSLKDLFKQAKSLATLHPQFGLLLFRLNSLKQIKFCKCETINEATDSICSLLYDSIKKQAKQIEELSVEKTKELKIRISNYLSINRNLQISKSVFRQKNISLSDTRNKLMKNLADAFDDLYAEFNRCIADSNVEQLNNMLEVMEIYRASELNDEMQGSIKKQYVEMLHKYQNLVLELPKEAERMFNEGNYEQLTIIVAEFKRTKREKSYLRLVKWICSKIKADFDELIFELNSKQLNKSQFLALNKKLKHFLCFQLMESLIEDSIQYKEKRKTICEAIRKLYNQLYLKTAKSVEKQNFKGIKSSIDNLNGISSTLLMGIIDQEFQIDHVDIKEETIDKQVRLLFEEKVNLREFVKLCNIYAILKSYDLQFETKIAEDFLEKIQDQVEKECDAIFEKARNADTVQQFDHCQDILKKLLEDIKKGRKSSLFAKIGNQIKNTEVQLESISNALVHCSQYNNQYLQRLRSRDINKFNLTRRNLQQQFEAEARNIQTALEQGEYLFVYDGLGKIRRFQNVDKYINSERYSNSENYRAFVLTKMLADSWSLLKDIQSQLKIGKIQKISSIQKFLNLQISTQGKLNKESLQIFNKKMIAYLGFCLPEISQDAPISSQYTRLNALKKQHELIRVLRNYVWKMKNTCSDSEQDIWELENCLANISNIEDHNKKYNDCIENLSKQINSLWEASKYRSIFNRLVELSKIQTRRQSQILNNLTQTLRRLVKNLEESILLNINNGTFETVSEDLSKLTNAENELKKVLGLDERKLGHQNIVDKICQKIETQISQAAEEHLKNKEITKLLQKLVELKKWMDRLPVLQNTISQIFVKIFIKAKMENLIGDTVREMEKIIEDECTLDATILKELMFKYSKQLAIPRIFPILRMSIKDAIQKFGGEGINKNELHRIYVLYDEQYKNQQLKYILKGSTSLIEANLLKINQRIKKLKAHMQEYPKSVRETIPKILANIFIFWSIKKSGKAYYEAKQMKKDKKYIDNCLVQPHAIQVLSILRFIGCDTEENFVDKIKGTFRFNITKLENHMMEIKTGEGKSVIIACMAILLALLDYKVNCACYSSYLSKRDFQQFKPIFNELGVIASITYGTFLRIASDFLDQKFNVSTMTHNIFLPKNPKQLVNKKQEKKYKSRVLLIDEVDIFFSDSFYGATYNPAVMVRNNEINQLIDLIWNNRELQLRPLLLKIIENPIWDILKQEYKDCIMKMLVQFRNMAVFAKHFDKFDYVVQNGVIGIKHMDGINFILQHGYSKMFAYIFQSQPERGNVKKQVAQIFKGMTIKCGHYSYAEIISGYDKIFGVTGTLSSLSKFEQSILTKYKINKKTFAPSVYNESLRKEGPIQIENDKQLYFQKIATKIEQSLLEKTAILVFFENEGKLEDFRKSEYAARFADRIKVVTQKSENRTQSIEKATLSETVTLFTAPFGRGTDFVVYDKLVEKIGVTVIQTFLSAEHSEQIQMKGRTARGGKHGLYQLILNMEELKSKYKIDDLMITKARQDKNRSIGQLLHEKRMQYMEEINKNRQKQVDEAKVVHDKSMAMLERLQDSSQKIERDDEFFFQNQ